MANVRIKDLPADGAPKQTDLIPIDLGSTRHATVKAVVESGRPNASKAEAEAGVDASKSMSPLTTKQAIDAQVGAAYVPKTVKVNAGSGMTGGGALSGDVTVGLTVENVDRLTKVDGIESGATKNQTDAYLLDRANHTGTQGINTVTGLQAALDGKATSAQGTKADTALQAPGGAAGQFLAKNSAADNDVTWISNEAATAVSYAPQTLTPEQQAQARVNIDISASNTPYTPAFGYVRSVGDWMRTFRLLTDWSPAESPSDWSAVWQQALDDMSEIGEGGTLYIPHGVYNINSGGVLQLKGVTTHASTNIVNIVGAGTGQTVMRVGSGATGLHLIGDNTLGARAYVRFQGINFTAQSANTGIGMRAERGNYAQFVDLKFVNLDVGAETENFLNARFQHCQFEYGNYGARLLPKVDAELGGVNTTTFTFDDCTFHGANEWGLTTDQAGMIRVRGGNFDGNGRFGTGNVRGGIRMQRPGRASAKGLVAESIYFESNADYDIRLEHGNYDCTHTVRDCDFHRNNMDHHAINNIFAGRYSGGTGYGELVLDGNSHVGYPSYVPDSSRKYVNLQSPNFTVRDMGNNNYQSSLEAPTSFGKMGDFAGCFFAGTSASPSALRPINIASIEKTGTGRYTATLYKSLPTTDTSAVLAEVDVNGSGVGWGLPSSANTIDIYTNDLDGVAKDFSRVVFRVYT